MRAYLDVFSRFKDREDCDSIDNLLRTRNDLAGFERSQLGAYSLNALPPQPSSPHCPSYPALTRPTKAPSAARPPTKPRPSFPRSRTRSRTWTCSSCSPKSAACAISPNSKRSTLRGGLLAASEPPTPGRPQMGKKKNASPRATRAKISWLSAAILRWLQRYLADGRVASRGHDVDVGSRGSASDRGWFDNRQNVRRGTGYSPLLVWHDWVGSIVRAYARKKIETQLTYASKQESIHAYLTQTSNHTSEATLHNLIVRVRRTRVFCFDLTKSSVFQEEN